MELVKNWSVLVLEIKSFLFLPLKFEVVEDVDKGDHQSTGDKEAKEQKP
jgi:hypothetical protein